MFFNDIMALSVYIAEKLYCKIEITNSTLEFRISG